MEQAAFNPGTPVRFGLIGAGGLATRSLAPAIHAGRGISLHAVAARSRERAESLEPHVAYDDYAALIADDDVEVVYVALNNAGHLPWVLTALRAGKHVICEKPLGLTEADVVAMTEAAEAADRLLVEAFWYRWHPRTLRLQQLLDAGDLGPVTHVAANFSFNGSEAADPAQQYRYDPNAGGGALYDVGCYALSFVHLALGASVSVRSADARLGPTGVDLQNAVWLATPDGETTAFIRSGISGRDDQQGDVIGELASVALDSPVFFSLFTPSQLIITDTSGNAHVERFEGTDPYRLMVESLGAAVADEPAFLVDLEHSRQVAHSTEAAFNALSQTGRSTVEW